MRPDARTESSRTHPRESSFFSLLSGWAQQGMQSYFATQRILLDLAMRQNASVMHVLRDRFSDPHHSPVPMLTDLAKHGMSNFLAAQQVLLDMLGEEGRIFTSGVKERVGRVPAALAMTDLVHRGLDTVIEMQREFVKAADKQTQNWLEAVQDGKALKSDALLDLAHEAMETFVRAEKKFLDVVAEEAERATRGKPLEMVSRKTKKTELAELAREATECFFEAQKKLFDVASRQVNAHLKATTRAVNLAGPLPIIPFSDLTREGVRSFVDAQKALMNAVTKHNGHTARATTPHRKRRARAVRTKAATTAHAVA